MSASWSDVCLKDITTIIGDGLHGTPDYDESGDYFFINGNNLNNGSIQITANTKKLNEFEFAKYKKNLNERTLLVSINGTLGNTAFYNNEKVVLGKSACYLNVKENINKHFVHYTLRSSLFQNYIHNLATGSTIKNVSLKLMRDFSFKLPDREVQDRLVGVLLPVDQAINLLIETNTTLEAIAQAIFKSWFVDFDPVHAKQQGVACAGIDKATADLFPSSFVKSELGLIPEGWVVKAHKELLTRVQVGKRYEQKTALADGLVPILDQGKSGIIGYHNEEAGVNASASKPVVVFANHTCYMRLISYPFSAIQNVLPFVGKDVDTLWLYQATKDKIKFEEYKGHWPDFEIKKTVLPSKLLSHKFAEIISPLVKKIFANDKHIKILADLRDTLLPRLMSGKLDLSEIEEQLQGVV